MGLAEIDTGSGRLLRVNRKYSELMGYSVAELLALDFMTLTHPDDLAPDLEQMERLRRGELREFALEKRLLRKDGTVLWVSLSVSPLWAPGERPTRHVAVLTDITARKEAVLERQRAEERFACIFEQAPDGLLIVDLAGRIVMANRTVEETLGYERDELLGTPVEALVPDERRRGHAALRESFAAHRYPRGMGSGRSRLGALRKDRTTIPVEISLSPLESGGGRLVVAAIRDVSERVRAEAERARLENRLREAQKMESLGTLAGGIAHDFNNLLMAISGHAELARLEAARSPRVAENLDGILAASARAAELVRQILAFSRQQPTKPVLAAVAPIVEEAARLLRATVPAGIELILDLDPQAPTVRVDPTRLHQVLINLGTNAWHAIERTTGRILLRLDACTVDEGALGADPPPGRYARIQVIDDGKGMDAATRERVFEPFFTTKEVGKGTGLGLAVVHGIVADHGGKVTVESAPGRGTTFTVYLPAAAAAPETIEPPRPPPPQVAGRVLYLDDEDRVVRVGTELLERLGYRVEAYARATEALAALRADPDQFDVVVTDHNMPGISGLEIARAVALLKPDLPVVLVSGNCALSPEVLAAANVRHLLEKPYTIERLAEVLAGVVAVAGPSTTTEGGVAS